MVLRPSLTCFSPEENGSAATPDYTQGEDLPNNVQGRTQGHVHATPNRLSLYTSHPEP